MNEFDKVEKFKILLNLNVKIIDFVNMKIIWFGCYDMDCYWSVYLII